MEASPTSWKVSAVRVKLRQAGRCLSAESGCISAIVFSTNEFLPVEHKLKHK